MKNQIPKHKKVPLTKNRWKRMQKHRKQELIRLKINLTEGGE